jgi:hypothetical protein
MHRLRWASSVLAIGVLVAAGLAVTAGPVGADPYGGCNTTTGCRPDNRLHTYCFTTSMNNRPGLRAAANYAMGNLRDQAGYRIDRQACNAGSLDIRFVSNTAITARGDYLCLERLTPGSNTCARSRIRLNPNNLANDLNRRKTACHEVGHSVGLQHGDRKSDCMRNGHVTSGHQRYNAHHVEHARTRS